MRLKKGDLVRVDGHGEGIVRETMLDNAPCFGGPLIRVGFEDGGKDANFSPDIVTRVPRCPDCGEPWEIKGHQTCQYPND